MDYFAPAPTPEEARLRRIKGNYRREFVNRAMQTDGMDSIPPAWLEERISELLAGMLQAQHPQARGGEDLPNLAEGEVEIARMTLANSVHGEVTSLRARRLEDGQIGYRMVDEYETGITLLIETSATPLTAPQVIESFRDAAPSQTQTDCELEFQSYFYPDLNETAMELGIG